MRGFRLRLLIAGLLLWLPCALAGQAARSADHVAGEVVDAKSGHPLPRALVSLEELRSGRNGGTVTTDADGRFRFDGPIAPGKYRLEGSAAGYLTAAYQQHGQFSTAIVTGAGVQTNALRLALTPAASLRGRVLDEQGDPVPHATVLLFRQGNETGKETTHLLNTRPVNDDGSYEFYPVQPGRYYLAARGTPWYAVHPVLMSRGAYQPYQTSIDPALDVVYPTVFYPAAASEDRASPFGLVEGEQRTADLQMVPQAALTLTLRRNGPDGPPPQVFQTLFGAQLPIQSMISMSEDSEMVTGLAPGRYTVREFTGNRSRIPSAGETVELTGGSLVRESPIVPEFSLVTVSLRTGTTEPLPERTIVTLFPPEHGPAVSAPVDEKGDAGFGELPPGEYRLRVAGSRRPDLPIGSVTVNGKPAADLHLHVAGGGPLAVRVVLSGLPVTVEGFAVRDGKPAAASLILLVPVNAEEDPELFRRDQSDLDGSFTLPAVAPGNYLLLALDGAWTFPWADLHALTPYLLHAQPLVVPAGSSASLHLRGPVPTQALH